MSGAGRIEGRVNGGAYELVQNGVAIDTRPLAEVHADEKFKRAIERNGWERLPV